MDSRIPETVHTQQFARESLCRILAASSHLPAALPPVDHWPSELLAAAYSVQLSPLPMVILTGEQGLLLPNLAMESLLSGLFGHPCAGLPIGKVLPQCSGIFDSIPSHGFSAYDEPIVVSQTREGRTIWSHLDFRPIVCDDNNVVAIIGVATDVTRHIERIQLLRETEQRLSLALESSGMVGVWDLEVKSNISTADANVASTFGLSVAECRQGISRDAFIDAIHIDDRPRVAQALHEAIQNNTPYRCRYRIMSEDGDPRWVITSGRPCYDEKGQLTRLLGVIVDITDQMEVALALQQSRFEYETLTETLPQIVWSCDAQGKHDYFSRRWSEFTGIQPEQITEETWKMLVYPGDWEMVSKAWGDARRHGTPYDIDYRFRHHSGEYRWLRVMALPMRDDQGRITRWFGTSTDIHESYLISAERERLAVELERIARVDTLTEALTRRAFMDRATAAISEAASSGSSVGFIMLDIDHFKSINDTYGHPGGDQVLTVAAKRIQSSVSQEDLFGRIGGEEFSILLKQCAPHQAQQVAERIRWAIHQDPVILDNGMQIEVTVSLGVTARVPSPSDLDQLLLVADQALYLAKTSGRNRAVLLTDKLGAHDKNKSVDFTSLKNSPQTATTFAAFNIR
ncbi:sensor domain-containing diguanylate cyclase [Planctomicrobium sp. SH664]|uniref:sensor domain-containing diguanylate cyclase n=1 Tax=Planctomicrobium sp. SH664 TaxID=3448125 RepID=UPI003F5AEACC